MKSGIHPAYRKVLFVDGATGDEWVSYSTMTGSDTRTHAGEELPMIRLEISAMSHPFWTGNAREVDTEGRMDRFRRRYNVKGGASAAPPAAPPATATPAQPPPPGPRRRRPPRPGPPPRPPRSPPPQQPRPRPSRPRRPRSEPRGLVRRPPRSPPNHHPKPRARRAAGLRRVRREASRRAARPLSSPGSSGSPAPRLSCPMRQIAPVRRVDRLAGARSVLEDMRKRA